MLVGVGFTRLCQLFGSKKLMGLPGGLTGGF